MNDRPLIIYHAGCWDGFCAAWVARQALGGRIGTEGTPSEGTIECEPEFLPLSYGENYPSVKGRDVYILDFSFPRPVMLEDENRQLCQDERRSRE